MTKNSGLSSGDERSRPAFSTKEICSGDSLSSMIHKLCHEIDNPLTAIISIAAVMQRTDLRQDQAFAEKLPSYAEAMSKEAWRVSGLAEKLLLVTSTRREVSTPCDANKVLRTTVAKLLDADEYLDAEIRLHTPSDAVVIELAQEQLTALFRELLSNSLNAALDVQRHSPSETPSPIEVMLSCDTETLRCTISNTVVASRGDNLSHLFEPFVTFPPRIQALGLGLTVAWAIVERARGTLAIGESRSDSGLTFHTWLELPRSGSADTVSPSSTTHQSATSPLTDTKRNILIIEDEAMVASAMEKILELSFQKSGGATCKILGGLEALDALRAGAAYDAILCDLNLRAVSGRHILEFIAANRPELMKRFAFLTGDSLSTETSFYLKASGRPFLFKPFEPEALLALVRQLFSVNSEER